MGECNVALARDHQPGLQVSSGNGPLFDCLCGDQVPVQRLQLHSRLLLFSWANGVNRPPAEALWEAAAALGLMPWTGVSLTLGLVLMPLSEEGSACTVCTLYVCTCALRVG